MNKQIFSKLKLQTASFIIGFVMLLAGVSIAPVNAQAATGDTVTIYPRNWTVVNGPAVIVKDGGRSALRIKSTQLSGATFIYSKKITRLYNNNLGKRVRICYTYKTNNARGAVLASSEGARTSATSGLDATIYITNCFSGRIVNDPSSQPDFDKVIFQTMAKSSKVRYDFLRQVTVKVVN